jgi:hypothetical protein
MAQSKTVTKYDEKEAPTSTKVIVTNAGALEKKYGARASEIRDAVQALVQADRRKGLTTELIELDNRRQMKKIKASAVEDATNCRENKEAIDGVYRALLPDYVMILGSRDVVPHQDPKNPIYGPHDPDRFAYGDLAYASDAPYSQNPESFIGPTRVVGRLPDIPNSEDPTYLTGLLRNASRWTPSSMDAYMSYFAVSAHVWRQSTNLSLKKIFGSADALNLSPPDGYKWKRSTLSALTHFINCHGAPADCRYYGEKAKDYPIAHDAAYIERKVREGTVVAAECCYGAELYDPGISEGQAGIPLTYLASKAYGFLGSSTIAYGPAEGNGAADLICRFFINRILEGASLGRAALLARQDFVDANPTLDPVDLKTIAQFVLLGDPSIHPVEVPGAEAVMAARSKGVSRKSARMVADRASRRRHLARRGLMIGQSTRYTRKAARIRPSLALREQLDELTRKAKIAEPVVTTYRVGGAALPKDIRAAFAAVKPPTELFHVVAGRTERKPVFIPDVAVLVARVEGGELKSYRLLQSR